MISSATLAIVVFSLFCCLVVIAVQLHMLYQSRKADAALRKRLAKIATPTIQEDTELRQQMQRAFPAYNAQKIGELMSLAKDITPERRKIVMAQLLTRIKNGDSNNENDS